MDFNTIIDDLIDEIDSKIQNNKLSRDDLEKTFNAILNTSKILFYFDDTNLKFIKKQKINLYLFFVAFIKNYLNDLNKYINNLDFSDNYVSDIKKEIKLENSHLENFLNIEEPKYSIDINHSLETKNNDELFKIINECFDIIEKNQKNQSQEQLYKKLQENNKLVLEKENLIKNTIEQTIEQRNKYLNYKNSLEKRYENDLNIIQAFDSIDNQITSELSIVNTSLKNLEDKIKELVEINQKLHDVLISNTYPDF